MLFTYRRAVDGGLRDADDERRLRLLAGAVARFGGWCDVEVDCAAAARGLGIPAERTILSHHDFSGTPADLVARFDRMAETPAAIYKLATRAETTADALRHLDVLARARATGRRAASIAMGEKGVFTRVLATVLGAELTYCAAEAGREAAPGQVALDNMLDLYRVDRLTPEPS